MLGMNINKNRDFWNKSQNSIPKAFGIKYQATRRKAKGDKKEIYEDLEELDADVDDGYDFR